MEENFKKVDKNSISVTPFSINDILRNQLETADDDSDLQESALDMSKSQNRNEGKQMYILDIYVYICIYTYIHIINLLRTTFFGGMKENRNLVRTNNHFVKHLWSIALCL